jgi:hypothetical protein
MGFLGGLNGADAAGSVEEGEKKSVRTRVYAPKLSVVGAAAGGVDEAPSNA